MKHEHRSDRFTAVEDQYAGYTVQDPNGEKIGEVDDLFLDENDQPEYVGVKMGFLGTKSTLIPFSIATVRDDQSVIEVCSLRARSRTGRPSTTIGRSPPEFENEVHSYYGPQQTTGSTEDRGTYADYSSGDSGEVGSGMREGDTESGEFVGHSEDDEGANQSAGSDLDDRDELRVQRTEEELAAGTREVEAGAMRVRKRVRTDRESIEVPTRREEVFVERVPVEGDASEAEIGEDEVVVPVTEEEVVASKRPVAKEEVRIKKDVVEDTEVVEEYVRREEVDVEDDTSTRRPGV